jgi:hypothetical protein
MPTERPPLVGQLSLHDYGSQLIEGSQLSIKVFATKWPRVEVGREKRPELSPLGFITVAVMV